MSTTLPPEVVAFVKKYSTWFLIALGICDVLSATVKPILA